MAGASGLLTEMGGEFLDDFLANTLDVRVETFLSRARRTNISPAPSHSGLSARFAKFKIAFEFDCIPFARYAIAQLRQRCRSFPPHPILIDVAAFL